MIAEASRGRRQGNVRLPQGRLEQGSTDGRIGYQRLLSGDESAHDAFRTRQGLVGLAILVEDHIQDGLIVGCHCHRRVTRTDGVHPRVAHRFEPIDCSRILPCQQTQHGFVVPTSGQKG